MRPEEIRMGQGNTREKKKRKLNMRTRKIKIILEKIFFNCFVSA